jgi:hypothetical protein
VLAFIFPLYIYILKLLSFKRKRPPRELPSGGLTVETLMRTLITDDLSMLNNNVVGMHSK